MEQLPKHTQSSILQLTFFTVFLFLLVAIPYTIYLKSVKPKPITPLTQLPIAKPSPFPSITPPPASVTTTCITVPDSYQAPNSTPAAYLVQDYLTMKRELCYPPALPPYPFTWQPYTNYQHGYVIDTPSNWYDKSAYLQDGTFVHTFEQDKIATNSTQPYVSFAWYKGTDPYATDSSFLRNPVIVSGKSGTVYTGKRDARLFAIFPLLSGYLSIESFRLDSAFYAFQHMLDSLSFK